MSDNVMTEPAVQADPVEALGDNVAPPSGRLGKRARRMAVNAIGPVVALILVIVAWNLIAVAADWSPLLLPTPRLVVTTLNDQLGYLTSNMWTTVEEAVLGYLLGVTGGILLGVALATPTILSRSMQPLILGAQIFPKITIAPLMVVWFGFGIDSKLILVLFVTFFPITISVMAGLRSLPSDLSDLAKVAKMSALQKFFRISMPWSLPQLFSGMRVSISFALTAAIVAEFVGANKGLGYIIQVSQANLETPLIFAAIVYLVVIGFIFYGAIVLLEKLCIPWHISQRSKGRR